MHTMTLITERALDADLLHIATDALGMDIREVENYRQKTKKSLRRNDPYLSMEWTKWSAYMQTWDWIYTKSGFDIPPRPFKKMKPSQSIEPLYFAKDVAFQIMPKVESLRNIMLDRSQVLGRHEELELFFTNYLTYMQDNQMHCTKSKRYRRWIIDCAAWGLFFPDEGEYPVPPPPEFDRGRSSDEGLDTIQQIILGDNIKIEVPSRTLRFIIMSLCNESPSFYHGIMKCKLRLKRVYSDDLYITLESIEANDQESLIKGYDVLSTFITAFIQPKDGCNWRSKYKNKETRINAIHLCNKGSNLHIHGCITISKFLDRCTTVQVGYSYSNQYWWDNTKERESTIPLTVLASDASKVHYDSDQYLRVKKLWEDGLANPYPMLRWKDWIFRVSTSESGDDFDDIDLQFLSSGHTSDSKQIWKNNTRATKRDYFKMKNLPEVQQGICRRRT